MPSRGCVPGFRLMKLAYVESLEAEHREKEAGFANPKTLAAVLESEVTSDRVERTGNCQRGCVRSIGRISRPRMMCDLTRSAATLVPP